MGQMIPFGGGPTAGRGYMASSARVGPCVIVLHEFFGLTDSFKRYADRLNEEEGFTVLAPDLYDGRIASNVEEATSFARSLDEDLTTAKAVEAIEHMRVNWHPRVGIVGFSLGTGYGMLAANAAGADAVVVYYGAYYPVDDPTAAPWRVPLLGHYATNDEWESLDDARPLFERLGAEGVPAELHTYDAGHWFANSDVPDAFDADAAELAWARTVDFLSHHLS
ncbi:MAG: carboxymethylenebutenolidase [Actinomycetota bacterium]|jgi:carboxymethylenebutenolidase|nr:carboxymethylenebutenolidase [Actinomycetota bacterium]